MRRALTFLLALVGCAREPTLPATSSHQTRFSMAVDEVFYIKPPVDRVILVGSITEGSVRRGDSLVVKCQSSDVPVVVEAIEHPSGPMEEAKEGQQVGLKLAGIRKEQATRGDLVVR